jgi:hypothetical protein
MIYNFGVIWAEIQSSIVQTPSYNVVSGEEEHVGIRKDVIESEF